MLKDLHMLPKVRDAWSYLYVEHCKIDRDARAIMLHDARGRVPVPCASLSLLMLGPGTSITHAAISSLADNGCLVAWSGEQGVRFYAQGMGETRSAANLLKQAALWADPQLHLKVVIRMYEFRFGEPIEPRMTLRQIRGKEGVRVREAYARASRVSGVPWEGRSYDRSSWGRSDPINRALSAANSCLYGICHAAIVSAGFSPALGFVHTGKMLSFVYDVADLYKTEFSIPVAFTETAKGTEKLESRVRRTCRDAFTEGQLLARIVPDIQSILNVPLPPGATSTGAFDSDAALPGGLWDPDAGSVVGGTNFAVEGNEAS
ncbi:type I-E CRISPR-associated endonuclease Cas1e [Limnochorda pilosa]|uniref:CRISPR-associated endonuclease Cas1 n=1 Tax=Limnochorda pilosa TaxID=1555112 RepID=A0A0K2SKF0_LIMPI|nr:type I-E CRISPR-associated endonuclease Cas1e [Limnochorda pilosa]BAS27314.1 CRISPR-associated protein Cas1 [Limnochorda pilosa]